MRPSSSSAALLFCLPVLATLLSGCQQDDPWRADPPQPKLICTSHRVERTLHGDGVFFRGEPTLDTVCETETYACPGPLQLEPFMDFAYSNHPTRYRCSLPAAATVSFAPVTIPLPH